MHNSGFQVYRAIVHRSNSATGAVDVLVPSVFGSTQTVAVDPAGLGTLSGVFQVPIAGEIVFIYASSDFGQVFWPTGASGGGGGEGSVLTHEAAANPHPLYLLSADAVGLYEPLGHVHAEYLLKTGGALTGTTTLSTAPVNPTDLVRLTDLQTTTGDFLPLVGGDLTGPLTITSTTTLLLDLISANDTELQFSPGNDPTVNFLVQQDGQFFLTQSLDQGVTFTTVLHIDEFNNMDMTAAGTVLVPLPSVNDSATTKKYTDDGLGLRVAVGGDTMTGALTMDGAGINVQGAQYGRLSFYNDVAPGNSGIAWYANGGGVPRNILSLDESSGDLNLYHYTAAGVLDNLPLVVTTAGDMDMLDATTVKVPNAVGTTTEALNVQTADGRFVNVTGDTLTGMLILPATVPTLATHASSKQYVDDQVVSVVDLHLAEATDAHDASAISFIPPSAPPLNAFLTATDIQTAIIQNASEIDGRIASGDTDEIVTALNAWTTGDPTLTNSDVFAASVIVADAIAAGAIVASKLAVGSIDAASLIVDGVITGSKINATTAIQVGTDTEGISIVGTAADATTSISSGTTTYGTGTGFWLDASGRLSLGTDLTYDGAGNLAITGTVTADAGAIGSVNIGAALTDGGAATGMYVGAGAFTNANTAFYVDSAGYFSLKDQVSWNGTTFTIDGNAVIDGDALITGSITTDKMGVGTINADRLTAGSITTGKLSVQNSDGYNLVIDPTFSRTTVLDTWANWNYTTAGSWFTSGYSAESTRGSNTTVLGTGSTNAIGMVSRKFPVEAGKKYTLRFRDRWDADAGAGATVYAGVYSSPTNPAYDWIDTTARTEPTAGWAESYVGHNATSKVAAQDWTVHEVEWTAPDDVSGRHVWASIIFLNYGTPSTDYEIDWVELVPQIVGVQIEDGTITGDKVNATGSIVVGTLAGNKISLVGGAAASTTHLLMGAAVSYASPGTGVYIGGDGRVKFGSKFTWDGATLSINGDVTAASGTIGGWTINPTTLTSPTSLITLDNANSEIVVGTAAPIVLDAGATSATTTLRVGAVGVYLDGTTGNYISTTDKAGLDIAGDISLVANIRLNDYSGAANQTLVSKYNTTGNQRSYRLYISTSGQPVFAWSPDGTSILTMASTATVQSVGVADGEETWVGASFDADDGAAGRTAKFWHSTDGVTWTQLGSTVTQAGVSSLFGSTAQVEIGSISSGALEPMAGSIYDARIYDGIGADTAPTQGTLVAHWEGAGEGYTDSLGNAWTHTGSAWQWSPGGGTGVYMDASGRFSIGEGFTYDPATGINLGGSLSYNATDGLVIGGSGLIQSDNYSYASGSFSTAGTKIDLANGDLVSTGLSLDGTTGALTIKGEVTATAFTLDYSGSPSLELGSYTDSYGGILPSLEAMDSSGTTHTRLAWSDSSIFGDADQTGFVIENTKLSGHSFPQKISMSQDDSYVIGGGDAQFLEISNSVGYLTMGYYQTATGLNRIDLGMNVIGGIMSFYAGQSGDMRFTSGTAPFPGTITMGTLGGDVLTIASTGNVGIGTTSPNKALDVVSSGTTELSIRSTTSVGDSALLFGNVDDTYQASILYDASAQSLNLRGYNNATRLTIANGGNVGIGTTSPTERLHVNGDALISGQLNCSHLRGDETTQYFGPSTSWEMYLNTSGLYPYTSSGSALGSTSRYWNGVYSSNWFRSSGDTGWFNETHGNGLRSTQTGWVTTYGSGVGLITNSTILLAGILNTTTTSGSLYTRRESTYGTLLTYSSTRDLKENVQSINPAESGRIIDMLRPVTYIEKFRSGPDGSFVEGIPDTTNETAEQYKLREWDIEYGFIAEELDALEPEGVKLASYDWQQIDDEGLPKPNGWKDSNITAILVAEVKELRKRIAALEGLQ